MDFNESNGKELGNVLTLEDENGEEYVFELLDALMHNEKKYLVCVPQDEMSEIIYFDSSEIIFLEVIEDKEDFELIDVVDEEYCEELFQIFKERNKDLF